MKHGSIRAAGLVEVNSPTAQSMSKKGSGPPRFKQVIAWLAAPDQQKSKWHMAVRPLSRNDVDDRCENQRLLRANGPNPVSTVVGFIAGQLRKRTTTSLSMFFYAARRSDRQASRCRTASMVLAQAGRDCTATRMSAPRCSRTNRPRPHMRFKPLTTCTKGNVPCSAVNGSIAGARCQKLITAFRAVAGNRVSTFPKSRLKSAIFTMSSSLFYGELWPSRNRIER